METKIILQRFKSFDDYSSIENNLEDGTFFIIAETGQFGAVIHKGASRWNILSPPNTFKDFDIPDGELVISSRDSINEAVYKLAQFMQTIGDNTAIALDTANIALNTVKSFEYNGDVDAKLVSDVEELKSKHVLISEKDFAEKSLEGLNPNVIYYIYEND